MFLAVDVGNTNMVLGLYRDSELVLDWRVATDRKKTSDEYAILLMGLFNLKGIMTDKVSTAWVSSVVPTVNGPLEKAIINYLNITPLFVGPGVKTGLNIKADNPREVGADRIVNAVAVHRLYGGPAVIVDFGTATSFCALSGDGHYLGGAIAPGIGISTDALFAMAAQLPRIKVKKPAKVIGTNTVMAMESGIYYTFIGQVKEIILQMKKELGGNPITISTGGYAPLITGDLDCVDIVNINLTLEGLRFIKELNTQ